MKIDHVAVAVRDVDASIPWYVDNLGCTLLHVEDLPPKGVRLAYLDAGTTMLQLVQPIEPNHVAEFLDRHGEGLHHICLAVDDIPTTLAQLPGESSVQVGVGGRHRRACFLSSMPNGLRIELTETAPYREATA